MFLTLGGNTCIIMVNSMVGLSANASVMARMVRKQWCGDRGLRSSR